MYKVKKNDDHLSVKFEEDFDRNDLYTIIHHVTMMPDYPCTDDIWLIGKHHAHIRMGDLEAMVQKFQCCCPHNATRKKTAIVAERGLTRAILELWVNAARKKVPFEMKMFHHIETAEEWLGISRNQMA